MSAWTVHWRITAANASPIAFTRAVCCPRVSLFPKRPAFIKLHYNIITHKHNINKFTYSYSETILNIKLMVYGVCCKPIKHYECIVFKKTMESRWFYSEHASPEKCSGVVGIELHPRAYTSNALPFSVYGHH